MRVAGIEVPEWRARGKVYKKYHAMVAAFEFAAAAGTPPPLPPARQSVAEVVAKLAKAGKLAEVGRMDSSSGRGF